MKMRAKKTVYIALSLAIFILLMAAAFTNKTTTFVPAFAYIEMADAFISEEMVLLPGAYEAEVEYSSDNDVTMTVYVDKSGVGYPFTLSSIDKAYSFPFYLEEYGDSLWLSYPKGDGSFSLKSVKILSEGVLNNNYFVLAVFFAGCSLYGYYMLVSGHLIEMAAKKKRLLAVFHVSIIVIAGTICALRPVSTLIMKILRLSSRWYVLLLILGLALIVVFASPLLRDLNHTMKEADRMMENDRRIRIGVFVILCGLFLFTRLYRLGSMMDGIHVDEIGAGYDALCIRDYGVDRWTVRYPVYFANYGTGQNALYTYLATLVFCFTDFSVFALRLPAVFCGFLGFIAAFFLSGKLFNEYRYRVMTIFLYIVCPMFFLSERWGLESYLLCSLIFVSMALLYQALDSGKGIWYILTGISFGVTLYTYAITYILEPLFLLFTAGYILWVKKSDLKNIILCAVPFTLLALPLALEQLINAGYINAVYTYFNDFIPMQKFRGTEFSLSHFIENLKIVYRLIVADDRPYNSSPVYGTMYYITVPFMVAGCGICLRDMVRSFRERKFSFNTLISVFFVISLIESLTVEELNINRSNEIYFCFLLFAVFGIEYAGKWMQNLVYALIPVYLLLFVFFWGYYFGHNGMMSDIAASEKHSTLLQPVSEGVSARDATRKYGDRGKLYIIDEIDEFQELIIAAYEGVSPYEFHRDRISNSIYDSGLPDRYDTSGATFYLVRVSDEDTIGALKAEGFKIEEASREGYAVASLY